MSTSKFVVSALVLAIAQSVTSAAEWVSSLEGWQSSASDGLSTIVFTINEDSKSLTIEIKNDAPLMVNGSGNGKNGNPNSGNSPASLSNLLMGVYFDNAFLDSFAPVGIPSATALALDRTASGNNGRLAVAPDTNVNRAAGLNWQFSDTGLGYSGTGNGDYLFGDYNTIVTANPTLNGGSGLPVLLAMYPNGNNSRNFGGVATYEFGFTGQNFDIWSVMATLDAVTSVTFTYNSLSAAAIADLDANDSVFRNGSSTTVGLNDISRPIPEPTSLALLGLGAMGLLKRRRAR